MHMCIRRFFVPKRGGFSERGKTMINVNMLHVFNDLNGKLVYKPFDVFEKPAKTENSDFVRFFR